MTEEIPQINERNASDRLVTVITAIERGSEEPMHDPKYFKWYKTNRDAIIDKAVKEAREN